jgi:hypothetical protein
MYANHLAHKFPKYIIVLLDESRGHGNAWAYDTEGKVVSSAPVLLLHNHLSSSLQVRRHLEG